MEFKEAYKKLQKLADGRYSTIQFEVGTYSEGIPETRCSLYIAGYSWTKYWRTWKEAFAQMEERLNPPPKGNEEIPNMSDDE